MNLKMSQYLFNHNILFYQGWAFNITLAAFILMFLLILNYDVTKRVAIIMISLFGTIWIVVPRLAAKQAYQPAEAVVKTFYLSKQVKDYHTIYNFQLAKHPSQIVKVTGWSVASASP